MYINSSKYSNFRNQIQNLIGWVFLTNISIQETLNSSFSAYNNQILYVCIENYITLNNSNG